MKALNELLDIDEPSRHGSADLRLLNQVPDWAEQTTCFVNAKKNYSLYCCIANGAAEAV
jgi:hypothetical protein